MVKKLFMMTVFLGMFVSYANAETIILEGTVRDFYDYSKDKDKNPDFENKKEYQMITAVMIMTGVMPLLVLLRIH